VYKFVFFGRIGKKEKKVELTAESKRWRRKQDEKK